MCESPILNVVWWKPSPHTPCPRLRPSRLDVTVMEVCGSQYDCGSQCSSCDDIQCHAPITEGVLDTARRFATSALCDSRISGARRIPGGPLVAAAVAAAPLPLPLPS